ncbi:alcohol dehydrogenase [Brevibacillus agri]|uniref:Alcohol dehydrogenase n=1 Tax=Brevibacillus agri TaxID=51101 RepID=A0A3M8AP66_9BACL|nr:MULTISPECIES: iron-containing alcohol dehydrogenase [Brevibacillus]ELK42480.1 alcohol dehydrogenase [Brevibacillus agri BAB-2500]EJL46468.1 alcohol dehydrogenase, class IV [Brevibacillus sp. CF112]MBY0054347.1 iron-containing alcohol dehydrogenase [Brevibacillus agri]MCG5251666.1 iron-containing alcohol dehydrogenase [Brevibacillus agri]MDN4095906.1 iron-containing alcohol dehydrogenase [Brevibacillus agri]
MNISTFAAANKLVTGRDSLALLPEEVARLKVARPMIVTDKILIQAGVVAQVEALLPMEAGVFSDVNPEPEIEIVDLCVQMIREGGYDGLIAVGGGSAIDIAKAASVMATNEGSIEQYFGTNLVKKPGLPLIAIPTTAGTGSEVTNISILSDTKEQVKKGIVSPYLLPDVAIVSPVMTLTCPPSVTAASGVDALVHAVEAYISKFASPVTDALAIGAMKLIAVHLPKAYACPDNIESREAMITASLMAGLAFGNAGVGAVHALAYPLGGRFHMAHGVSNSLLLPYVMRANKIACLEKLGEIAQALGENVAGLNLDEAAEKAIEAMTRLCRYVEIPQSLREFNIPESAIAEMAEEAMKQTRLLKNNPRALRKKDIEDIYRAAY